MDHSLLWLPYLQFACSVDHCLGVFVIERILFLLFNFNSNKTIIDVCPLPVPVSFTGNFLCIWPIILQQHSKEHTQDQTSALESCYLVAHDTVSDSAVHVNAPCPSWVGDSTFHMSQVGILLWFPLKIIIFTLLL